MFSLLSMTNTPVGSEGRRHAHPEAAAVDGVTELVRINLLVKQIVDRPFQAQAVVEGVVETSIDKNIVRQIAQSTACRGRSLLAVVANRRPDIELISGRPVSPDRCLMLWRARQ